MGAVGAIVMAAIKRMLDRDPRRLSLDIVRQAAERTAKLSAFVMFILIGARMFSLAFYGVNGHLWVEHLLTALPGGQIGFLLFVNLMVFLLAFFLDFFELAFIIIPLLAPVAAKLGIDLVWFGVILSVNMQTSFMHPPFGFALFYLRSVAPREVYIDRVTRRRMAPVTTEQIYWGAVPFVLIQLLMVGLLIAFPGIALHTPTPKPAPGLQDPSTGPNGPSDSPTRDGIALPGLALPGSPLGMPSLGGGPALGGAAASDPAPPTYARGDGGPTLPLTSPFSGSEAGPVLPLTAPRI